MAIAESRSRSSLDLLGAPRVRLPLDGQSVLPPLGQGGDEEDGHEALAWSLPGPRDHRIPVVCEDPLTASP